MRVLVTGGAGYIGSHTLIELLLFGHDIYVLDNLSNGYQESLNRVKKITNRDFSYFIGDIRNDLDLDNIFRKFQPEAVIHFAGMKAVGESVEIPLKYYENNVTGSIKLLQAMDNHNCKHIVFSSSATVYGEPIYLPFDEKHSLNPLNPYGQTKLMVENILRDWASDSKKVYSLRYFNPIGAHISGLIGENPVGIPNNLVPYISQVAIGKLKKIKIYGDDYDTRDGTGERDYIHVTDLAIAHLAAINSFDKIGNYTALNIGTGKGTTVKELIKMYERVINKKIDIEVVQRRPGDIASSVACPKTAIKKLNWSAKMSIYSAIESSWHWQSKNPSGY